MTAVKHGQMKPSTHRATVLIWEMQDLVGSRADRSVGRAVDSRSSAAEAMAPRLEEVILQYSCRMRTAGWPCPFRGRELGHASTARAAALTLGYKHCLGSSRLSGIRCAFLLSYFIQLEMLSLR